jgi:hypothetical protein
LCIILPNVHGFSVSYHLIYTNVGALSYSTDFINPADYAQKNAECKAQEVATKLFGGSDSVDARKVGGQRDAGKKTTIVIGSDTMYVIFGDLTMGVQQDLPLKSIFSRRHVSILVISLIIHPSAWTAME